MSYPTLYFLHGKDGYWVVSRGGHDLEAFEARAEAQALYDRLTAQEAKDREAAKDCPFARHS